MQRNTVACSNTSLSGGKGCVATVLSTSCRHWLLSACAYNSWQHAIMISLKADVHLKRSSRLINGGENSGSAFAAFVISLVQHGKHFRECHSWPSHLQADLVAACQRDTNLGMGGEQQPWQILLKDATIIGHLPREFSRVFWHFLRHRDHHFWSYWSKKAWFSHSLHSSYYLARFDVLLFTFS